MRLVARRYIAARMKITELKDPGKPKTFLLMRAQIGRRLAAVQVLKGGENEKDR